MALAMWPSVPMGHSSRPQRIDVTSVRTNSRERILEAARTLFYRQGFEATSFTDIAREAGIPRGNFYYHFKSKDEILLAVIDQWGGYLRGALEIIEGEAEQPLERIGRMLRFPLDESQTEVRYGCPLGSLVYELRKGEHSEAVRRRAVGLFDLLVDWLVTQLRALGWAPGPARDVALRILSRLQGAILVSSAYDDRSVLEAEIEDLEEWIRTVARQRAGGPHAGRP